VSLNIIELVNDNYIQAILRDLTEHKKIKGELEVERERLKRAEKLAGIGWWSYQVKKDTVIWSEVLFDILNIDKDNFDNTFEAFNKLVHPDDRDKVREVMANARETSETIDYNLRIDNNSDDEIIHVKCRSQSAFNEDGELVQISGVMQDVTSQLKDQQELKRREELFESLFLDSPVAIAMIDTDGKVQKLNKSFETLFGYSEEELAGKNLLEHHLPEGRKEETEDIYKHVFANEGASKYYEDQRVAKSGEVKDLLVGHCR
jgi:PAS domain S-box-containing protein